MVYKLESRWDMGVWLGFRDELGDVFVGTNRGVCEVGSIRQKGCETQMSDREVFDNMVGTPWEPDSGRGGEAIRANINIPRASEGMLVQTQAFKRAEKTFVRPKINKSDRRFGCHIVL